VTNIIFQRRSGVHKNIKALKKKKERFWPGINLKAFLGSGIFIPPLTGVNSVAQPGIKSSAHILSYYYTFCVTDK
jgi:hypothetical protein